MALMLLVMAWHRSTYIIGFMGWYDTFKNTKVNYYLFNFTLAMGPLVYLYVRSTIRSPFKIQGRDLWHFLPVGLFLIYRVFVLLYDRGQEGWDQGYDGKWHREIHLVYVSPIIQLLNYSSQLLYFGFTLQLYYQYRQRIRQFFSNTYRVELNWLRNFLAVYTFLFIYGYVTEVIDAFVMDLHYTHFWWHHFFSACALVYLGMMAYFTDLKALHQLTFDLQKSNPGLSEVPNRDYKTEMELIAAYLNRNKPYLQPDFTLKEMARGCQLGVNELSESINSGFGCNFNELINSYRVEEVKARVANPKNAHLSLLAIAFDSGFRSKATFNRAFKALTGQSPSSYRTSLQHS